ncbi:MULTISPECIES: hypothetical protein [Streptomyces]|uniref:Uncharacterized protein n=1 Tax=Streptomyces osmaniensis TaxID=593134 RepID=A0ABP6Y076_9ACTN|nr:hypothetical protein KJK32_28630 [Streptomyces sp. JCM17656]
MTMHAMSLPGYQIQTTKCGYCEADLGLVHRQRSLLNAWEGALLAGPAAIDSHLQEHNTPYFARHTSGCPFRELPPAVHASCTSYRGDMDAWGQLIDARKKLDKARGLEPGD